jgi:hypothetical protein
MSNNFGDLPAGWERGTLGTLTEISTGKRSLIAIRRSA